MATFTLSTGSTTTFSTTSTVVGTDQRWRNLSVAGVLFWDHDWDVPGDRSSPPIHLQSDPSVRPGSCCGARLHDRDNVLGNEPMGLTTGTDMAFRFRLTREVRRVLSGINTALWDCGKGRWPWSRRLKRCR